MDVTVALDALLQLNVQHSSPKLYVCQLLQLAGTVMTGDSEDEPATLVEDVYDVLSSWLTCKESVPECWKGNTSPMYEKSFIFAVSVIYILIFTENH